MKVTISPFAAASVSMPSSVPVPAPYSLAFTSIQYALAVSLICWRLVLVVPDAVEIDESKFV